MGGQRRIRIENEMFARMEKRYSEEEQANYLMSLLMDNYPLLSAVAVAMEPGEGIPSLFAHRGLSGNFIKEMYQRGALPVFEAARKGEVTVREGDRRAGDPSFRIEHDCRSLYAAPCRLQGETLGAFAVDSADPDLLSPETREDLRAYARIVAFFLALRSLKGKISRVPEVDSVTRLHSFKSFHEVLHRELSRGKKFLHPVSLLFIKIRNLREMNEVYGHVAADEALREAAARVTQNLRDVDYAARSGGAIYVVMPQMEKAEAAKTAGRIAGAMESSPVGRGNVFLRFAIGVASYPGDGETERVLIPHTDAMVHESMRKGGNAVSVFRE